MKKIALTAILALSLQNAFGDTKSAVISPEKFELKIKEEKRTVLTDKKCVETLVERIVKTALSEKTSITISSSKFNKTDWNELEFKALVNNEPYEGSIYAMVSNYEIQDQNSLEIVERGVRCRATTARYSDKSTILTLISNKRGLPVYSVNEPTALGLC